MHVTGIILLIIGIYQIHEALLRFHQKHNIAQGDAAVVERFLREGFEGDEQLLNHLDQVVLVEFSILK